MKEYKVKAIVLSLGSGQREKVAYIRAKDEKEAKDQFMKKHMTIEVKEVYEYVHEV